MRIDGVIFDMDGLMFDTEQLALPCTARAAREQGWDMCEEDVRAVIGCNFASAEEHFRSVYGGGFDYAPVRARALELMGEHIAQNGIRLKVGLIELLDFLDESGIPYTVATSSDEPTARRYFRAAGIAERIGRIMSGEKVKSGKPDPEIFLRAAALLGRETRECAVLEDSIPGITAAYRAGACPIMVPDLVKPTPEVREMAFAVADDLLGARDIIANINRE